MYLGRIFFVVFMITVLMSLTVQGSRSAQSRSEEAMSPKDATEMIQRILNGLAEGDFEKYSRNFSPLMKQSQPRESFLTLQKKIRTSLGKLVSLEYMGYYRQARNFIHIFKAKFRKDKDDVLIKLVLDSSGPGARVTGLWLDSPSLEQ